MESKERRKKSRKKNRKKDLKNLFHLISKEGVSNEFFRASIEKKKKKKLGDSFFRSNYKVSDNAEKERGEDEQQGGPNKLWSRMKKNAKISEDIEKGIATIEKPNTGTEKGNQNQRERFVRRLSRPRGLEKKEGTTGL